MACLGDQWIYFSHKTFPFQFDFLSIVSVRRPCSKFVLVRSEHEDDVLVLCSFRFVEYSVKNRIERYFAPIYLIEALYEPRENLWQLSC